MNAKHITDLTLENFRGFRKLELSGFQAVNLIVGQNNVGKTSLLEGLVLAANPLLSKAIPGMLHTRATENPEGKDAGFFRWLIHDALEKASLTAGVASSRQTIALQKHIPGQVPSFANPEKTMLFKGSLSVRVLSTSFVASRIRVVSVLPTSQNSLVTSVGNALRKRQGEDLIHKVLKKVDPRIQRVRVDPTAEGNIVAVDIGLSEMIPITQAGQGAVRLVTMLAELIGENAQVCIIDEIGNGIHHTALKDVWRGVAEISAAMGVQVFATTHSQECLAAANEVFFADDSKQEKDFALIQLMRVKDEVVGKVLSEARVNEALENEIELR